MTARDRQRYSDTVAVSVVECLYHVEVFSPETELFRLGFKPPHNLATRSAGTSDGGLAPAEAKAPHRIFQYISTNKISYFEFQSSYHAFCQCIDW